jgi:hypothetical protein
MIYISTKHVYSNCPLIFALDFAHVGASPVSPSSYSILTGLCPRILEVEIAIDHLCIESYPAIVIDDVTSLVA